jgi:Uma2 family endonuclease
MIVATDYPTQAPGNPIQSDRLITLQGGWEQFRLIQRGCANTPGARLAYFDGAIEILMPGQLHETFSRIIGWLLTYFLAAKQVPFTPTGSVTQELEGEASAQADESYCIGSVKPIPDLSIEVVFSSGGLPKLSRYRALGVPEVWFWQDGSLALYHLRADGYVRIDRSELPGLKELDLDLFKRCVLMAETDSMGAITLFARAIGAL